MFQHQGVLANLLKEVQLLFFKTRLRKQAYGNHGDRRAAIKVAIAIVATKK